MLVLESTFMAMQSVWSNGRRKLRDTCRQPIFASGLRTRPMAGRLKAWPNPGKAHGV